MTFDNLILPYCYFHNKFFDFNCNNFDTKNLFLIFAGQNIKYMKHTTIKGIFFTSIYLVSINFIIPIT